MTRLLVFIAVLVGFVTVLSARNFHHFKVDNGRFVFEQSKNEYEKMQEDIAKQQHPVAKEEESEAPQVEAKAQIEIPLDTAELQNGAKVFAMCTSCHGKNAEGKKGQKAPKLAGQYNWYIEAQLHAMKKKERVNAVMDPYLKRLSDNDIKDVALYLSKFPW